MSEHIGLLPMARHKDAFASGICLVVDPPALQTQLWARCQVVASPLAGRPHALGNQFVACIEGILFTLGYILRRQRQQNLPIVGAAFQRVFFIVGRTLRGDVGVICLAPNVVLLALVEILKVHACGAQSISLHPARGRLFHVFIALHHLFDLNTLLVQVVQHLRFGNFELLGCILSIVGLHGYPVLQPRPLKLFLFGKPLIDQALDGVAPGGRRRRFHFESGNRGRQR